MQELCVQLEDLYQSGDNDNLIYSSNDNKSCSVISLIPCNVMDRKQNIALSSLPVSVTVVQNRWIIFFVKLQCNAFKKKSLLPSMHIFLVFFLNNLFAMQDKYIFSIIFQSLFLNNWYWSDIYLCGNLIKD